MKNVACILLYDSNKKFLLQHRTDNAPTFPDYFGFFGGKIEEGESPEEAIRRECVEELEYELKNPKLILNTIRDCKYGKRNLFLFLEKFDKDKKLVLHEGKDMKWVAKNEIKNFKIAEYLIDILMEMYNKI
ncbi:MAG: NUDIX domain-containing protein [Patescibacteria group bacterium]|nr:NUDIX domain-containing protein [Patescibacteria group bacterium]